MTGSSDIADLLALTKVRRMLLDMGMELNPNAPGFTANLTGPLELWLHHPRPDLDGVSPMHALRSPAGEERVRAVLSQLASRINDVHGVPESTGGRAGQAG